MGLLYTKLKIFHYPEKLASLPLDSGEIRAPLHVRLKPTNICNHRCSYCAYRSENLQLGQDMSLRDFIPQDQMRRLVQDLADMGVQAVTFSGGGEPFCYPYLQETVLALAERGVAFASLTNGSLLSGKLAEIFAHRGTWLRVSMDGWDGPSYANYRKVGKDEFAKVLGNMESFKRLDGACRLGVNLVVDHQNAPHLHHLIGLIQATGADSVKVSPCIISNASEDTNQYHQQIFVLVKEQIAAARSDHGRQGFEIYDAYHELSGFEKIYTWCPYLQILPVIGADLNVYACHDKAYNLREGLLGSIKETGFKEFWMNGKEKFFAIDPSRNCNHHCEADGKIKMVLEYLEADPQHLGFV